MKQPGKKVQKNSEEPIIDKDFGSELYVVVIGASAGGLDPINELFDHLPALNDVCFVIIQHLSPDYKSLMGQLLAKHTDLTINNIEHNMVLQSGNIYLIPPNQYLKIKNYQLLLEERSVKSNLHLPINIFMQSLADEIGAKSIGVVLSGTGSDGTIGCEAIHQAGGTVIVQKESSATFDSMPKNVIRSGIADIICKPDEIGGHISSCIKNPFFVSDLRLRAEEKKNSSSLEDIFELISKLTGQDFSDYKKSTILRRIAKRMTTFQFKESDKYIEFLRTSNHEIRALAQDFLIGVTEFFRDPKVFEYLEENIIEEIVSKSDKGNPVRIWVAGCSTGQEAYSVAMLFLEYMDKTGNYLPLKIFATDLNVDAIATASKGHYNSDLVVGINEDLLAKYFNQIADKEFEVKKELRDCVVFAHHNIISDPPFNLIDLVCCRNLLIYLNSSIQEKVLTQLRYSIKRGGYLFLGSSETLGANASYFKVINERYKLYQSKDQPQILEVAKYYGKKKSELKDLETEFRRELDVKKDLQSTLRDALIEEEVVPTAVVNSNFEIVQVAGAIDNFVRLSKKVMTFNILKMVSEELYLQLHMTLLKSKQNGQREESAVFKLTEDKNEKYLRIKIRPFREPRTNIEYYIISFHIQDIIKIGGNDVKQDFSKEQSQYLKSLEMELLQTKEYLQSTVEELETSNEELQSTNEELIAANEELQSSNEELQSLNEELYTVNNEFQNKIEELGFVNDDLNNLLQNTRIGTIFLDKKCNIRRFTNEAAKEIKIRDIDLGRPISDFNHNFQNLDINEECKKVLGNLVALEMEVETVNNDFYLMGIIPYRTQTDMIDGIVVTYVNINELVKANALIKQKSLEIGRSNKHLEQFAYVATHDLRSPLVNLTSLIGFIDKKGVIGDKNKILFEKITVQTAKMQETLNDLISVVGLHNGHVEKIERINLSEILNETLQSLEHLVTDVNAEINIDCSPDLLLSYPKSHLRSIIQNLLTNAFKFKSADRKPIVDITVKSNNDGVTLIIEDNGIGIPEGKEEKVFGLFERVEHDIEGKGIGLFSVKSLLESKNGSIEYYSKLNKGTTFIVQLSAIQIENKPQYN